MSLRPFTNQMQSADCLYSAPLALSELNPSTQWEVFPSTSTFFLAYLPSVCPQRHVQT